MLGRSGGLHWPMKLVGDGFWLARWLIARGIEAHVIHSGVADTCVPRL